MKADRESTQKQDDQSAQHTPDGEGRTRRGLVSLGLALAVMAAMACQGTDLTGPSFDDDANGVETVGTEAGPADDGAGGGSGGGNGSYGEKW